MNPQQQTMEEIFNCNSSANDENEEEEIVHIIQNSDHEEVREKDGNIIREKKRKEEGENSSDQTGGAGPSTQKETEELVFWVPALLMLGREQQRIAVSQDEIRRRVSPPECLSQTMLLSLLRLSKEKGKELRQMLAKNDIKKLTYKSAVISCFTRLTETEAAELAEDFFYLASRNLRLKEINREIVASRGGWKEFETQSNMTKTLLLDIIKEIEARDTDLTLMTHGFSPLIIRAVIDILIEIITFKEVT